MQPEQPIPPAPDSPILPPSHPTSHTYQDDLAQAMNVTEAPIVQEMLADARERDVIQAIEIEEQKERKWYSTSSIILIILTLAVLAYGTYYYLHLTVKVQPAPSVGVFQNSDTIVVGTTTPQQILATLGASTTLPVNKPTLINLVTDPKTNALITNSQLYSFLGADIPEPLQSVISVARWGVVNTGQSVTPFIVASVNDPIKASKEFGIAEPTLLKLFSVALGIDPATQNIVGLTFESHYFYNLPVRMIQTTDSISKQQGVIFLYGNATNSIVVITTKPEVLKAVYDTVINQQ